MNTPRRELMLCSAAIALGAAIGRLRRPRVERGARPQRRCAGAIRAEVLHAATSGAPCGCWPTRSFPRDERSGSATDAGVPEFMDFMMLDRARTMQAAMRGRAGLARRRVASGASAQRSWSCARGSAQRDPRRHRLAGAGAPGAEPGVDVLQPASATSPRRVLLEQDGRRRTCGTSGQRAQSPRMGRLLRRTALRQARRELRERIGSMSDDPERLGIGFIGSGFNARSTCRASGGARCRRARRLESQRRQRRVGRGAGAGRSTSAPPRPTSSIADMVADPAIDAIWLCGPNHARIENVEEIVDAIERGKGELRGLACEKPLARNVAEAKRVIALARRASGSRPDISRTSSSRRRSSAGRELLWARGAAHHRPAVPGARGGGAQRPAHALVLAGQAAGRRRAQRHDVPLGAGGAAPAHRAGAAALHVKPVRVTGHIASLKWTPARVREAAGQDDGRESTTDARRPRTLRA